MFPKGPGYKTYAIIFTLFSFAISNVGLSKIIEFSLPMLMFLYPLTIILILMGLVGRAFGYDRRVYISVAIPTTLADILDLINTMPAGLKEAINSDVLLAPFHQYLPFFSYGMGWVIPSVVGLVIGLAIHFAAPAKRAE